jgi:predicted sugar kinase
VQQLLGEHFAPAQGGAYTSAAVGRVVQSIDGAAIGQSSWGPTGFAILPSQAAAEAALHALRTDRLLEPGITLSIVAGLNRGALLTEHACEPL